MKWLPSLDNQKLEHLLLVIILVTGLYLRLLKLGHRSLWIDEVFTANRAHMDLSYIFSLNVPPLHILFVKFMLNFGTGEAYMRFPSVVSGVLGIWLIYLVGKRFFNPQVGLLSAALLSVSVFHIHYSQDARYYAHMVFFSLATIYFLFRALDENKGRWWAGFVIFTALNIYNHYYAFFVFAAEALAAGFLLLKDVRRSGLHSGHTVFFGALAAVGGLYLPRIFNLLQVFFSYTGTQQEGVEVVRLTPGIKFFHDLFGYFNFEYLGYNHWISGSIADYQLPLFLLFLFGLVRSQRRTAGFFILMITVPFSVFFIINVKHFFAYKYVIFLLPVYLLMLSKGVTDLASLRMGKVMLPMMSILILSLFAVPLQAYYDIENPNYREVAHFLNRNVAPDDLVVFFTDTYPIIALKYYYNGNVVPLSFNSTRELMDADVGVWLVSHGEVRRREPREFYKWAAENAVFKLDPKEFGKMQVYLLRSGSMDRMNGDFEMVMGDTPVGWTLAGEGNLDPNESYTGFNSIKLIKGKVISDSNGKVNLQSMAFPDNAHKPYVGPPGRRLKITNSTVYALEFHTRGQGARGVIEWYDDHYRYIDRVVGEPVAGDVWSLSTVSAESPSEASYATVMVESVGNGTAWVDHITFDRGPLVKNGDFKSEDGWLVQPSGKPSRRNWTIGREQDAAGRYYHTLYDEPYLVSRSPVRLYPNTTYTYGFDAMVGTGMVDVYLRMFKAGHMPLSPWEDGGYDIRETRFTDPGKWSRVEKVFTNGEDDGWAWIILKGSRCNPPDTLTRVTNVSLEIGNLSLATELNFSGAPMHLYNPGFELDEDSDTIPDGWNFIEGNTSPVYSKSAGEGNRSVAVGWKSYAIAGCPIRIKPNTTYDYSHLTRLQYYSVEDHGNRGRIVLHLFSSDAMPLDFWKADREIDLETELENPNWQKISTEFTTSQAEKWFWIGFRGSNLNPAGSYVWVDDVKLEEAGS